MSTTRVWTLGAAVAVLAIFAIAYVAGIQPFLLAATAADASTASITKQTTASRLELARLSRVAAKESTLAAQERTLARAVPSALRLNTFSRELTGIAAADQVTIQSLVPSVGTSYAAPAGATATTAAATATTAAAPAAVSGWFGKTDPAITAANFTVVPMSVVVVGSEKAVLQFASDAQKADRLYAVSAVSTTTANGVTTGTLVGSVYALAR